jgi:hypothetical protein
MMRWPSSWLCVASVGASISTPLRSMRYSVSLLAISSS